MVDGARSYGGTFTSISGSRHRYKDERTLARLGKKQVLKVPLPKPASSTDIVLIHVLRGASGFYLSLDSVAPY